MGHNSNNSASATAGITLNELLIITFYAKAFKKVFSNRGASFICSCGDYPAATASRHRKDVQIFLKSSQNEPPKIKNIYYLYIIEYFCNFVKIFQYICPSLSVTPRIY
jgi:hypothetical protein